MMKISEVRDLDRVQLLEKLKKCRDELLVLNVRARLEKKGNKARILRVNVARILTVLNERDYV